MQMVEPLIAAIGAVRAKSICGDISSMEMRPVMEKSTLMTGKDGKN